jgi:hypothetical protein
MSTEAIQRSSEPDSIDASAAAKAADVESQRDSASKPIAQRPAWRRRLLIGAGVLALVVVLVFGVPWVRFALSTVSTDDFASFLDQARTLFLQQSGDSSAAQQAALQSLENLRQQQASSLAYFDVFLLLALATLAPLAAVLLMKRSVAEKGARIGGE